MNRFKQTWWDNNLNKRFSEFESWVGSSNAYSKEFFRGYIKGMEYKSLIDLGCGNATEFFAYKEEYPSLRYLGVDSSRILFDKNTELGVPMLWAEGENIPLKDNHSEIVFSRHVLEHQPDFRPLLSEMVRLAEKEAIHVFFIIPREEEIIHYDDKENLYHNTFKKEDIEVFLRSKKDVESFSWLDVCEGEQALIIIKKAS